MRTSLGSYHKHIDNGGFTIEVFDLDGYLQIEIDSQYYGYPSVTSTLNGFGFISPKQLIEIGNMFIAAAFKVKDLSNVES